MAVFRPTVCTCYPVGDENLAMQTSIVSQRGTIKAGQWSLGVPCPFPITDAAVGAPSLAFAHPKRSPKLVRCGPSRSLKFHGVLLIEDKVVWGGGCPSPVGLAGLPQHCLTVRRAALPGVRFLVGLHLFRDVLHPLKVWKSVTDFVVRFGERTQTSHPNFCT